MLSSASFAQYKIEVCPLKTVEVPPRTKYNLYNEVEFYQLTWTQGMILIIRNIKN